VKDGLSNTLMMAERRRSISYPSTPNDITAFGFTSSSVPSACAATWNVAGSPDQYTPRTTNQYNGSIRWGDGRSFMQEITTVMPPNGPSCHNNNGNENGNGFYTASSWHTGGFVACMGDGSVKFIRDSINVGNQSADAATVTGQSPFGVWGALGSRSGGESVSDY
jgi:hypothetical protein